MSEEQGWGVALDEDTPVHPAVELILARMESHPEEFTSTGYNAHSWKGFIDNLRQFATPKEKRLLKAAERKIGMDDAHKKIMKKLLNGDSDNQFTEEALTDRLAQLQRAALQQQQQQMIMNQPAGSFGKPMYSNSLTSTLPTATSTTGTGTSLLGAIKKGLKK